MPLEIERRFIARVDDALLARAQPMKQRQAYLTVRDLTTVRIRQEGETWVLAVKADATALARHEIQVEVPEEDGRALFDLARGGSVEKTRHTIGRWEIDVYEGWFEGLVIAEAELHAEDETLPEVPAGLTLVREITAERGLSSRGLAGLGEAEARALVARLAGVA
jgi:CYTH domain-containing protein